ncbi:RNA polymerase sigma factor [Flavobacterium artemisiae]|uniref:RNA polymerase sigma factor n=1 Tax=Flavobacterium artemisiae TaxID=2126556 RepID=A0ABW4HGZ1_9FLAO
MKLSDRQLLELIAEKDEKSFNEFYKRYSSLLYKWALNRIGNADITNDIAQDFWSTLWLNPQKIKTNNEGSAKNFMLHFYTFRILDYLRANKKQKEKTVAGEEQLNALENSLSYTHILEDIQEQEIYALIDEVLIDLPELTRQVFEYRWRKQYSIQETSKKLNLDEKGVYNRTFVALTAIRNKVNYMLEDEDGIDSPKTLLGLAVLLNLF